MPSLKFDPFLGYCWKNTMIHILVLRDTKLLYSVKGENVANQFVFALNIVLICTGGNLN